VVDDTCQYPTLFIGNKQFSIEGGEEFWLSKTPAQHRSKDWDSAFPRMVSHARIVHHEDRRHLCVAVTHLDHIGQQARVEQAGILARWVRSCGDPVILMGDFNDAPGSATHQVLTAPEAGLKDTWQTLGRPEGLESYTHHGFSGLPCKTRMDWILASAQLTPQDGEIIRDHEGDRYPSDHFPYRVDLVFSS
jgi:endonuclease/exonuclease/phosphatase family metal-dependent hydrolase